MPTEVHLLVRYFEGDITPVSLGGTCLVCLDDLLIDRSLLRGFLWWVFDSCVGGAVAELDLLAHSCSFLLIFAYS